MNKKDRQAGFKALLKSHQANVSCLVDTDGEHRRWRDASAECKLEYMARDAVLYDVPFAFFAQEVRAAIDSTALLDASLRLALRSVRELCELERLVPDNSNFPPSLIDRFRYALATEERVDDSALSCKKLDAVFKERHPHEEAKRTETDRQEHESTPSNGRSATPAMVKNTNLER
jgi:hypothetical protein